MTAPNHIIGGIVITGLFGSFLKLNILANPIFNASTILGSLIPDIDYTKSTIGKIFRPISKYLNRRFGHRTVTHSILAMYSGREWINTGYSIGGGQISSYISKVRFTNELEFVDTLRYLSPLHQVDFFMNQEIFRYCLIKAWLY